MSFILDYEESHFLSFPPPMLPLPNRGRRSCACVCDSEGEVLVMEGGPQEEPGLVDVRSETWEVYALMRTQRTVRAFGSSLQKTQRAA